MMGWAFPSPCPPTEWAWPSCVTARDRPAANSALTGEKRAGQWFRIPSDQFHKRMKSHRPKQIGVVIVEDHRMFREQISRLIDKAGDMKVCGGADNIRDGFALIKQLRPAIAIVDITLKGSSGLELLKDLRAHGIGVPVLVLSMHDESLYAERALRAGARGYITKHEGGEKLMQAIRHVLSGQIYVSEKMSAHILKIFSGGQAAPVRSLIAQLSDREFEVFELPAAGVSPHPIARRLHISTKTVDAHRANIKTKLIIKTTSELISYAARWMEHRANRE